MKIDYSDYCIKELDDPRKRNVRVALDGDDISIKLSKSSLITMDKEEYKDLDIFSLQIYLTKNEYKEIYEKLIELKGEGQ